LIAPLEYRATRKIARIHDPRRDFALSEIESEVRYDPLTGDSARICHFAFPKRELPDLSALAERTRGGCPFCPESVERVTPRYPAELLPEGRMRRNEALLVPNLFPYDDVSAIVSMSRAHFLAMDAMPPPIVADALKLARDFIISAAPLVEAGEVYGIVTWNYMPPSGASQLHPHMQVIVTDTPGNQLRRELDAEARFLTARNTPYPVALLDAERGGARWLDEADGIAWWVPYCPTGMLGDAQAMFVEQPTIAGCDDATLDAYAQGLCRMLAAYARMGLWSFNLTLMPDAQAEPSGRHRLSARLLPRFYLHPHLHNSDTAYLQLLLGEKFAMVTPEQHAAELRALLTAR